MRRLAISSLAMAPFAALAAVQEAQPQDDVQSWLGAFVFLIRASSSAGPYALVFVVMLFTALIAWLFYLLPKISHPLASAIAMLRRGTTDREADLERELEKARAEVESLEGRVRVLEHRDEERRRAAAVMIDALEAHMAKSGVDTSLIAVLRETMVHDAMVPKLEPVAA